MGNVRFVLNRAGFRDQVLRSAGTKAMLGAAISGAAPEGVEVEVDESGPRARARIYGTLSDEASAGTLSQAIGRMRA